MGIEHHIHNLLFAHDCVIVPGFGGFLTHYRSARIDPQRPLVHPPSKELSFNKHLVSQDGLLVDRLMQQDGMDFALANATVEAETAKWRDTLNARGRLELPRLGTFFHDHERNLQFQPDRRENFLKEAFGLRPVEAMRVRDKEWPLKAPLTLRAGHEAGTPQRSRNRTYWLAAALAALAFTGLAWYMGNATALTEKAWGSLALISGSGSPRYELPPPPTTAVPPVQAGIWSAPTDLTGVHRLPIAGPEAPPVAVDLGATQGVAAADSTAVVVPGVKLHYHIIGGCFLEKENADRFIAELQAKGFAASLIDRRGGLYRVAYGSYPLRATALEALSALRKEEAPDAWLLTK